MAKVVYIVKSGHIPYSVASNRLTAYESLKSLLPLLEKDYIKSYEQVNRDLKRDSKIHECMTPTGYYTITEIKLLQRKNAKP